MRATRRIALPAVGKYRDRSTIAVSRAGFTGTEISAPRNMVKVRQIFERRRGARRKYWRSKNLQYLERLEKCLDFCARNKLKLDNQITLSKPPEGGVFDAISTDENPWPH